MSKDISRREFLKLGGLSLLVAGLGGGILREWLTTAAVAAAPLLGAGGAGHTLVVVQLSGGNDGLNTVIPFTQGAYYDARPKIGIPAAKVLRLTDSVGLHPNMDDLQKLYQAGHVAVIQGVGYPNPILSHFRSMAVWLTGDPTAQTQTGWLGRYLDETKSSSPNPLRAVSINRSLPLSMVSRQSNVPCITQPATYGLAANRSRWWSPTLESATKSLYANGTDPNLAYARQQGSAMFQGMAEVATYQGKIHTASGYPQTPLGQQLEVVAALLGAGLPTKVFYTELGGFDDHAGEESHHGTTLGDFSASVGALMRDLTQRNLADRVTVLAFSEFGRRVPENGSLGTDHGEAGPVFLVGNRVKGGLYGDTPNLSKLHQGDIPYSVDFRSVYATVLQNVLDVPPKDVLGTHFETLPCF